jgi:hypothetical protein
MNHLPRLAALCLNCAIPILGSILFIFRIIFEERRTAAPRFRKLSPPIDPCADGEYGNDRYGQEQSVSESHWNLTIH